MIIILEGQKPDTECMRYRREASTDEEANQESKAIINHAQYCGAEGKDSIGHRREQPGQDEVAPDSSGLSWA